MFSEVEAVASAPAAARPKPIRLSFCLNAGPRKGQPQSTALVVPEAALVRSAAANKLRLKKKDVARARLFVWGSGRKLDDEAEASAVLQNDGLIAVSLGEPYAGPTNRPKRDTPTQAAGVPADEGDMALLAAPQLSGRNDAGGHYASLAELWADQV